MFVHRPVLRQQSMLVDESTPTRNNPVYPEVGPHLHGFVCRVTRVQYVFLVRKASLSMPTRTDATRCCCRHALTARRPGRDVATHRGVILVREIVQAITCNQHTQIST